MTGEPNRSGRRSAARRAFDRLWPFRWRFLAFVLVGATGVLVNLIAFTSVQQLWGASAALVLLASTVAFAVALLWNFTWNYVWTFRDRRNRPLYQHFGMYAGIQLGALAINLVMLDAWTFRFGVASSIWGQFLGILSGAAWGFGANLRWNFRTASTALQSSSPSDA
ncbi:MAG: GtrA family protein [Thermoplasmata archaeon]